MCDKKKSELLKEQRLGMANTMKNKLQATIVAYRNSTDIDVQFTDGIVVTNKSYQAFRQGLIRHPHIRPENQMGIKMKEERIGQTQQMNNGMVATIIQYNNAHDITIQFEDGIIVEHIRYKVFTQGGVSHPNIKATTVNSIQEFAIRYYLRNLGFRKIEQGEWQDRGFGRLELDFYHEEKHIAIEYDGGHHRQYDTIQRDIRKDTICQQLGIILYRLRDPMIPPIKHSTSINYVLDKNKVIRLGLIDCKEELVAILNKHNIVHDNVAINFKHDVESIMTEYRDSYINYYANKRIGEKHYNKQSQQYVTIIAYRSAKDLDVQFEDGAIRTGIMYSHLINGRLCHPSKLPNTVAQERIGSKHTMNNGLQATIIAYRKSDDIDVQFDDGAIRYGVTYDHFKDGKIGHPSTLRGHGAETRLGEEKTMNCGLQAKVIAYRQAHDIDVQFSTGEIRQNVDYYNFKTGRLVPINRYNSKGDIHD